MPRKTVKKQTLPVEPKPVNEALLVQEEPIEAQLFVGDAELRNLLHSLHPPKGIFGSALWDGKGVPEDKRSLVVNRIMRSLKKGGVLYIPAKFAELPAVRGYETHPAAMGYVWLQA